MQYPITLTPDDDGTFLVTCDLLPEVTSFGEGEVDPLRRAEDAVAEALAARLSHWQATPLPGGVKQADAVKIPLLLATKIALMNACIDAGPNRAELARRLGWHREQVDRVFRFGHHTRVDQFEAVAAALGLDITVRVERAA